MECLYLYIQQKSFMPLGGPLFLQDSVLPYCCYRNCTGSLSYTCLCFSCDYRRRSLHFRLYYIGFNGENLWCRYCSCPLSRKKSLQTYVLPVISRWSWWTWYATSAWKILRSAPDHPCLSSSRPLPIPLTTSIFLYTFSYHTSLHLLPVLQHIAVSLYSWFNSNANTSFLAVRNDRPPFQW